MSSPWIKHDGGTVPVSGYTIVECQFKDGTTVGPQSADCWFWKHKNNDGDIIAYRIVSDQNPSAPEEPTYEQRLRDQAALAAMQGDWAAQSLEIGCYGNDTKSKDLQDRAALYFEMADAFISARKQKEGGNNE